MQNLDFPALFQHFNIVFLSTIACACLAILFSKIPAFIKFPTIACVLYAAVLVLYPEQVKFYLGDTSQSFAAALFVFAAGSLAYSFYRFMKAGMTIAFWLLITAVIGATAFPNVVNQQVARATSEMPAGQEVQSQVLGYITQRLSYHP